MTPVYKDTLTKLRSMFSNAIYTPVSHVPEFTLEEFDLLKDKIAPKYAIPQVWVEVASNADMRLEMIYDPSEVVFLQNEIALIDKDLAEAGVVIDKDTKPSGAVISNIVTSSEEKAAVADKVKPPEPAVAPTNNSVTPESHMMSGPLTQDEAKTEVTEGSPVNEEVVN